MDYQEHPQEINVASCSKLKTEITAGRPFLELIASIQSGIFKQTFWH
jgi:hypothetical protein